MLRRQRAGPAPKDRLRIDMNASERPNSDRLEVWDPAAHHTGVDEPPAESKHAVQLGVPRKKADSSVLFRAFNAVFS